MELPLDVPLGVSGTVTVPRDFVLRDATRVTPPAILLKENQRVAYLAERLNEAFGRPLIGPGSEAIARAALAVFRDTEMVMAAFAEKALETLRDGKRHDRTLVSEDQPRVAIRFQSWNGTHREAQPERFGAYLSDFAGVAFWLRDRAGPLAGFLQIDAFVREDIAEDNPLRPLDEIVQMDVEFSFLPGFMLGAPGANHLPRVLLINRAVCTQDEVRDIEKRLD